MSAWKWLLQFLLGSGIVAWELIGAHHQELWSIVIAVWLLGAPLESLVRLVTSGRINISLKKPNEDGDE